MTTMQPISDEITFLVEPFYKTKVRKIGMRSGLQSININAFIKIENYWIAICIIDFKSSSKKDKISAVFDLQNSYNPKVIENIAKKYGIRDEDNEYENYWRSVYEKLWWSTESHSPDIWTISKTNNITRDYFYILHAHSSRGALIHHNLFLQDLFKPERISETVFRTPQYITK